MKLSQPSSVADSFSSMVEDGNTDFNLQDGSRVAVVGGGPAGSFFSYFLLKMAAAVGLDVEVDIFEPRSFNHCGPAGCNHCGGIVSESLVQILSAEGLLLPRHVVQRGVESYVVHMDVGDVAIQSPVHEQRIAALYRGNGPREGGKADKLSFDAHLQSLAVEQGAHVVRKLVNGMCMQLGKPVLVHPDGQGKTYDLVAVATGVNSNFLRFVAEYSDAFKLPRTTRGFIAEFRSSEEEMLATLGRSVHVFLLDLPRFEFAAIIPKGPVATLVMVGDDIDEDLVEKFLNDPVVAAVLPADAVRCVCSCSPLINLGARARPYTDRMVMIGDSGVTRLYKDGIGAAYRTGKSAATTAVFNGVSARDFETHFWPTCRNISRDNAVGKVMFASNGVMKRSRLARRMIREMAKREQDHPERSPHMSSLLWNMFTGSAPYSEMFLGTLHPGFIGHLMVSLAAALRPKRKKTNVERRAA